VAVLLAEGRRRAGVPGAVMLRSCRVPELSKAFVQAATRLSGTEADGPAPSPDHADCRVNRAVMVTNVTGFSIPS
jgi:hypothetical protein